MTICLVCKGRSLPGATICKLCTENGWTWCPCCNTPIKGVDLCDNCQSRRVMNAPLKVDYPPELVDHPQHYGGDTQFEHVKVAEALGWDRCAFLYNATKYLWRLGRKDDAVQEIRKAIWYLERKIKQLERKET